MQNCGNSLEHLLLEQLCRNSIKNQIIRFQRTSSTQQLKNEKEIIKFILKTGLDSERKPFKNTLFQSNLTSQRRKHQTDENIHLSTSIQKWTK